MPKVANPMMQPAVAPPVQSFRFSDYIMKDPLGVSNLMLLEAAEAVASITAAMKALENFIFNL